jgi:hypothetical protein
VVIIFFLYFPGCISLLLLHVVFFYIIFCSACLVVTNSFNFCLLWKVFTSSIMKDSFAGYINLNWQLFYFRAWKIFHALPAFRVFVENSSVILMGMPSDVTDVPLLPLSVVLLCIFSVLTIMRLEVFLLWSYLFGLLGASCTWMTLPISRLGKFSVIFCWLCFLCFWLLSFPILYPWFVGLLFSWCHRGLMCSVCIF